MHISEGVLSGGVLVATWAASSAGIAVGLKKTDPEKIVGTALISSAFFLASLVNLKIGPSSVHMTLVGPMGLILGWAVFPAVFVALLLQAMLFQFGGLLVLGANTFSLGTSALVTYILFGKLARKNFVWAFVAGAFAVVLVACITGSMLVLTDLNFLTSAKLLVLAHLPLALLEGVVCAFLISWLKRVSLFAL